MGELHWRRGHSVILTDDQMLGIMRQLAEDGRLLMERRGNAGEWLGPVQFVGIDVQGRYVVIYDDRTAKREAGGDG